MQSDDDPGRRFARWWTPCFVVVWLTTMATFACAYFFGFGVAKPLAFIAGVMIVALVVAGLLFEPRRDGSFEVPGRIEYVELRVNPATGLPMTPGAGVDVGGNVFGQSNQPQRGSRDQED